MILRDRVPFRVSWWGMIAVLLLGVLILPSWSQSKEEPLKKESPQLPEAESKADVTDELAAPAPEVQSGEELADPPAGVDAGSIKVVHPDLAYL